MYLYFINQSRIPHNSCFPSNENFIIQHSRKSIHDTIADPGHSTFWRTWRSAQWVTENLLARAVNIGRAFPHTFVISRAHAHEYTASISVFTIPLEHARAYDVRTSVNLATAQQRAPLLGSLVRRVGGEAPARRRGRHIGPIPTYLPTYPAFGIHADRSPLLTVDKPCESDCRPDSPCVSRQASIYTRVWNTHASAE